MNLEEEIRAFRRRVAVEPVRSFPGVLQSHVCVHYGVRRVENHCRSLHPEPVVGEDKFSDGVCSIVSPLGAEKRMWGFLSIGRILSFRLGFSI